MTCWRAELRTLDETVHPLMADARAVGLTVRSICEYQLVFIEGDLSRSETRSFLRDLLWEPLLCSLDLRAQEDAQSQRAVEILPRPGVTHPASRRLFEAARRRWADRVKSVHLGRGYEVDSVDPIEEVAEQLLVRRLVEISRVGVPIDPRAHRLIPQPASTQRVPLTSLDEGALRDLGTDRQLALNLHELLALQDYFIKEGREPTDVELECVAQFWSEHCSHKTFEADLTEETDGEPINHPSLMNQLKSTLRCDRPWIRSAFVDNAGVIALSGNMELAAKVETHNHPSALEPFGGAHTGIGGVIRDIFGVSARPFANTDVLCFGPQDLSHAMLPPGVLHPRQIARGVVHGVGDYGNKMGLPTVNGAVLYHPGYVANPLVFCGSYGLRPAGSHPRAPQPGDLIIVLGGETGRDGLRGATFSSMSTHGLSQSTSGTAVQIGDPIRQKGVMELLSVARDERLYTGVNDCGAGGLSSAVGELIHPIGATVQLDAVPCKVTDLSPWEIWLSESQERMVLTAPPESLQRLRALARSHEVHLKAIGTVEPTGQLTLTHAGQTVLNLRLDLLHDGCPKRRLVARWTRPTIQREPTPTDPPISLLLNLLASENGSSRAHITRTFDTEVLGATRIRPLVGPQQGGPSDAAYLQPAGLKDAIVISCGISPDYGAIDPYAMGAAVVDEAVRNAICVGADPKHLALLDNFCWGDVDDPEQIGRLLLCVRGAVHAARAFAMPFVSGKDSLNNAYQSQDGRRHSIPGTLLISAFGRANAGPISADFKETGSQLILIGATQDALGGGALFSHLHRKDGEVPIFDDRAKTWYERVNELMQRGLIQRCHDCSAGGLAVAVAEMAMGGELGATIDLSRVHPSDVIALFSESNHRLLLEIHPNHLRRVRAGLIDVPFEPIGRTGGQTVTFCGEQRHQVTIDALLAAFHRRAVRRRT